MNDNEDLLDRSKNQKEKSKVNYENKTIIYLVCMVGGELIFTAFLGGPVINILINPLVNLISVFVVAVPIEILRKYLRKRKNKKKNSTEKDDPLWFHILESAFSILILYWFLQILLLFLTR